MFHKVKSVAPLTDYKLSVQFCEGVTELCDVKPLISTMFSQFVSDECDFEEGRCLHTVLETLNLFE